MPNHIFFSEVIGTGLLILLGDGVVAGVLLSKSKAENSGWIVITFGWAMAVAMAVYAVGQFDGAHLNPAVTLGLAVIGSTSWSNVPRTSAVSWWEPSSARSSCGRITATTGRRPRILV